MAFFNVIRPWVKESSVSDATVAVLDQIFDVQTSPESYDNFAYCVTKKAIDEFVGTEDVSLLGVLEDVTADGTTCAATLPSGTRTWVPPPPIPPSPPPPVLVLQDYESPATRLFSNELAKNILLCAMIAFLW
jgi:hypothetical protein